MSPPPPMKPLPRGGPPLPGGPPRPGGPPLPLWKPPRGSPSILIVQNTEPYQ